MTLPINTETYTHKFLKTLNQDVQLTQSDQTKYDIIIENGDYKNITGLQSLNNACIIAILTRYGELTENPTYKEFGCKAHRILKDNQTKINKYKLETYITKTLQNIRRIRTVNTVTITEEKNTYNVYFNVTSHNDETIRGTVNI